MKKIILIAIFILLVGCTTENIRKEVEDLPQGVYRIDCVHRVICYERGVHAAAFSCVHTPIIPECYSSTKTKVIQ